MPYDICFDDALRLASCSAALRARDLNIDPRVAISRGNDVHQAITDALPEAIRRLDFIINNEEAETDITDAKVTAVAVFSHVGFNVIDKFHKQLIAESN